MYLQNTYFPDDNTVEMSRGQRSWSCFEENRIKVPIIQSYHQVLASILSKDQDHKVETFDIVTCGGHPSMC
jgi:hypothetical protein